MIWRKELILMIPQKAIDGKGIDIVYANTRIRITGIPKRFNDFIRVEKQNSVDRHSTRLVSEKESRRSKLSMLDAGGFHDSKSIAPTEDPENGAVVKTRTDRERAAVTCVTEYIQDNIFMHFQLRAMTRFGTSLIFFLLPVFVSGTDMVFFPGFPRASISDSSPNPKISTSYLLTYGLFFVQDSIEWMVVGFYLDLSFEFSDGGFESVFR